MQNLLHFLFKYGYFVLFIFLEIVCFNLIVRYNEAQRQTFLQSSNAVTGWIYSHYQSVKQYFRLSDVAHQLAAENADLRKQQGTFKTTLLPGSTSLDSNAYQQYELQAARVINNSVTALDNYFTLEGGRDVGFDVGMGVIDEHGVVGILTGVSNNYARGISVLNRACRVSVAIARNHFIGNLYWEGGNPLRAKVGDVPKHADLQIGDRVITSGFSAIFPEGLSVGEVIDFSLNDGSNFYSIDVRLSNDISKLHYVYVVKNLLSTDQLSIERTTGR